MGFCDGRRCSDVIIPDIRKPGFIGPSFVVFRMAIGIRPVSDLLADEYAGKILSLTFAQPRCVQEICALTGIPVAVAYRRVNALEAVGLIKCSRTEVTTTGKKSKYYTCQVDMVRLTFREGGFEVEIEWKDRFSESHLRTVMTG